MSEFLASNDWQWRPGRCELGVSLERPHGLAVLLLVLHVAGGGNGTVLASNKTAYTYFRIDTASTPGYITAA